MLKKVPVLLRRPQKVTVGKVCRYFFEIPRFQLYGSVPWISILRRTDYPHSDDPQNKAKLWQVPINFNGRKLFSRTKVIIIP